MLLEEDYTVLLARTKTHKIIEKAYSRGYRVVDGILIGIKGVINIKLYGKQRYPSFSYNGDGTVFGIPVHMFAAYCYYGYKLFDPSLVVRHVDGDTLNISNTNLVLGTRSENEHDKSAKTRSIVASIARKSQGITPKNAKLTTTQVIRIREYYARLNGKRASRGESKSLCLEMGVTRTTLAEINKNHSYKGEEYYAN